MDAKALKVKCTRCTTTLQFTPRAAESQVTCPKCGQRMRVKTPGAAPAASAAAPRSASSGPRRSGGAAPHGARQPAQPKPAPRKAAPPAARGAGPQRAAAKSARPAARPARTPSPPAADPDDWLSFPTSSAPSTPPYLAAPAAAPRGAPGPLGPSPAGAFAHPKPARRSGAGGMGTAMKVLLGIGAVCFGGVALLVVLVAVLGLIGAAAGAQSKSTITVAGWSVDAPGKEAQTQQEAFVESKTILHRRTNSEFTIGRKQVAQPGQEFTTEQLLDAMRMQMGARDARPVKRGGLDGYRFTTPTPAGPTATMEMYKLDARSVLLVAYITGVEKEKFQMGKARFDAAKTEELDDPEAFFESLRRG